MRLDLGENREGISLEGEGVGLPCDLDIHRSEIQEAIAGKIETPHTGLPAKLETNFRHIRAATIPYT